MTNQRQRTTRTRVDDDGEPLPDRRQNDRWHIGKEVPVAIILVFFCQTAGVIWWMAQLSSKLDNAIATISEFKLERYTREDARRDRELIEQKMGQGASRDGELDRRLTIMEGRVDRMERK